MRATVIHTRTCRHLSSRDLVGKRRLVYAISLPSPTGTGQSDDSCLPIHALGLPLPPENVAKRALSGSCGGPRVHDMDNNVAIVC